MSRNRKNIRGRGVFGEFLARARDRETSYLGSDSLPDDEMFSSPSPLQELLAKTPIHISNSEVDSEICINVNHVA